MLPISKHRTLVIPHRLALAAAGVCLALSFTVDQTTIDDQLHAERSPSSIEQFEDQAASAPLSPTENAADAGPNRGGKISLLPWFSGVTN